MEGKQTPGQQGCAFKMVWDEMGNEITKLYLFSV